MAKDIIGTHRKAVNPYGIILFGIQSNFQFRSHSIRSTHQNWIFILSNGIKRPKTSKIVQYIFIVSFSYGGLYLVYGFIAFFFVYSCRFVSVIHSLFFYLKLNFRYKKADKPQGWPAGIFSAQNSIPLFWFRKRAEVILFNFKIEFLFLQK